MDFDHCTFFQVVLSLAKLRGKILKKMLIVVVDQS